MKRQILLDSGVLGLITHPRPTGESLDCKNWLRSIIAAGDDAIISDAIDYEVRREYLRRNNQRSLWYLDDLITEVLYLSLDIVTWRRASLLWADARKRGHITAPPEDLDIDIILAAQAQLLATPGIQIIIATTNVRHLAPFADARLWQDI